MCAQFLLSVFIPVITSWGRSKFSLRSGSFTSISQAMVKACSLEYSGCVDGFMERWLNRMWSASWQRTAAAWDGVSV